MTQEELLSVNAWMGMVCVENNVVQAQNGKNQINKSETGD